MTARPGGPAAAGAAACLALTVLVFSPALRFPLLAWDDAANVVSNPGLALSWEGLSWMLTGSRLGHWHPLSWLSLALDRALWGGDPLGFHLTSVLLHGVNAGLFWLLARRLLPSAEAALFAALFWAFHPLRVESVAWVSERRDVLSGALALGAALAWLRGAEAGEDGRGRAWRRAALALGAAAMAAKVFAAVLPAVLLVLDARLRGRPRWREKLPWALCGAIAVLLNAAAQAESGAAVPWSAAGLFPRLAQAAYGLAFYPAKTLWPSGLATNYERSALLEPAPFVLAAAASSAGAALAWGARRRWPGLAQAALAYALLLLPALGLFKSGRAVAADRYAYLPGLPMALLAGAALARLGRSPLARLSAAGLLLALAAATRVQLQTWSSDEALWTRACAASPLSYFARLRLASAREAAGRADEAARERAAAAALHREVFSRAAAVHESRGDGASAAAARRRAEDGLTPVLLE